LKNPKTKTNGKILSSTQSTKITLSS